MHFLYNIFVSFMIFGMKVGALFNAKLKKGLEGRKQSCSIVKQKFSPTDKVICMHAASLGEYEQGLPVLEKLKENYPAHKILITFFSPSGYENVVKKNTVADAVCYLPFDRKVWMREFISNFQPEIFFTVKYDFWYNLLEELKQRNCKTFVVSALFYETQIYFKPYGNWFVKQLSGNVDWFFHQTRHSENLAAKIGLKWSSTSGDTRFDRVKQNLQRNNFVPFIEDLKSDKTLIVFGSSWEAEERMAELLAEKNKNIKLILAPHDLNEVEDLRKTFPDALLYSQLNGNSQISGTQVLIIDSIGLLSKIYSYADIAVVGGGFHSKGLHNILEAAAFGVPVIFGCRYRKNPEADALLAQGGGMAFDDEFFAASFVMELLKYPEKIKRSGQRAFNFVEEQPNAAELILKKILSEKPVAS